MMEVKTYGTRGSIAICRDDSVKTGGNTTSLRIFSSCIPSSWALAVDGGTGYRPLSQDVFREGLAKVALMFTHWHDDHLEGVKMALHTFNPHACMKIYGPVEHGQGCREILQSLMQEPRFPLNFQKIQHRFDCENLDHVGTKVLVVHPVGGFNLVPVHIFQSAEESGKQITLGRSGKFFISECMVIRMYKTKHPEYTISYRFEERPTGKVFVFLTDHENTDGFPQDLLAHVQGADLLIQDCQYSRGVYDAYAAGFGHATPDYCARLAAFGGVKIIGITHHDPDACDMDVDCRCQEVRDSIPEIKEKKGSSHPGVFACRDYAEYEV